MLFNSYVFLFLFLPGVLVVYYLTPKVWRNFPLVVSSYIFYAYWDYRFCSLLLSVTVLGYACAKGIAKARGNKRQEYLICAIVLNLAVLCYFKYAGFFVSSLLTIFPGLSLPLFNVVLPIGISFFVFQALSYVVDVYRERAKPVNNFIDFACYIAMFPQLIAGPIVRFNQIEIQLQSREYTCQQFGNGIRMFIVGLAKKVLVADTLADIADQMLQVQEPSFLFVWIGLTAFSLQIYLDFSGYSDMAIGLGHMLGFNFPENFHFPYQARGIADFWRRWHMSLSGWLRDYLYIPLGGSRCSTVRTSLNLLLTMTLCGLWHGATWTYILWGAYYGILLVLERPFRQRIEKLSNWLVISCTYFIVLIGWVFFRAESFLQAKVWFMAMSGLNGFGMAGIADIPLFFPAFIVFTQCLCWFISDKPKTVANDNLIHDFGYLAVFIISVVAILGKGNSPFLYYQF